MTNSEHKLIVALHVLKVKDVTGNGTRQKESCVFQFRLTQMATSWSNGIWQSLHEMATSTMVIFVCRNDYILTRHMLHPPVWRHTFVFHSLTEKSPLAFGDPGLAGFILAHVLPLSLCLSLALCLLGETWAGIYDIRMDNGDGWSIAMTGMVGPGGKWICRQKKDLWIPDRGIPLSLGHMPAARGKQGIYHEHGNLTWQDSTSSALYRLKIQIGCPAGSVSGRTGCMLCRSDLT